MILFWDKICTQDGKRDNMSYLENYEINIKTIKERLRISTLVEIGDNFCLMDINSEQQQGDFGYPCRLSGVVFLFCVKGAVNLSVNLNEYEIRQGQLIICTNGDILKVTKAKDFYNNDTHIVMLALSHEFASDLRVDFKRILNEGLVPLKTPIINTDANIQSLFEDHLRLIMKVAADKGDLYEDSVRSLVSSLVSVLAGKWFLEIGNIKSKLTEQKNQKSSHKRMVFEQFLRLVSEHYSEHRQMAFYADKLCLSPKYLSKLVKEVSGKHAPEWIEDYVILEAKHLLKYSNMPVKEVVYRLHFSNQTVFYKYFKEHTGMTPSEYRKQ